MIELNSGDLVKINKSKEQKAKGRIMTAKEASKLPDIVGKKILIESTVRFVHDGDIAMLVSYKNDHNAYWLDDDIKIMVID